MEKMSEATIAIDVEQRVIDEVRSGDIAGLTVELYEDNMELLLETAHGHLLLCVEELPVEYRSCYMYNGGEFPYVLKQSLQFLLLRSETDRCLTIIVTAKPTPGRRFSFQKVGEPGVDNPDGDCCLWEMNFEIIPAPEKPKVYLMRWNPAISSFTEKDYRESVAHQDHGSFRMNWSIYEWEEANRGDTFYMLRTGDDKAGIVFYGYFLSDPYTGEDWKGTSRRRCYVDMICSNPSPADDVPLIPLAKLKEAIPSVDWDKGHSGELLSDEVAEAIGKLLGE